MLSCRDLVKICNSQIDFSKNKDYKSMSEEGFIYSSVGVCAYNRLIEVIKQFDKEDTDSEKKNSAVADRCVELVGKFKTSDYMLSTAWDNAVLNIYKLAKDGTGGMSPTAKKYIEDILSEKDSTENSVGEYETHPDWIYLKQETNKVMFDKWERTLKPGESVRMHYCEFISTIYHLSPVVIRISASLLPVVSFSDNFVENEDIPINGSYVAGKLYGTKVVVDDKLSNSVIIERVDGSKEIIFVR